MSVAIFIRHTTQPGRRDDVRAVWERHMQPAIATNPGHEAYHYCLVDDDDDGIVVYQQYVDAEAAAAFLTTPAYAEYLAESEPLLLGPPTVTRATPVWQRA